MSQVMTSAALRSAFVDFFAERGHRRVASASLVPSQMSTTLFTIAGMEPFVPIFLGEEPAPAKRAVSVQRCLRVAGAKSDIENVGRTGRHGTYLEMLGNFGFADYGKIEAITWAWEFLTQRLALDPTKLYITVHTSDDEAQQIWETVIGIPPARITRFDEDNFWTMGPTGPCGPCSEIFYDTGAAYAADEHDTGPNLGQRYVEIWNLVFQQYNREADGSLRPLSALNIDTGAGLERVLAVVNGQASMYETDLFTDLVKAQPPVGTTLLAPAEQLVRQRIIADHARAATALIADGVHPSNVDRGYVLRFLIRRAIRNGRLLGYPAGFLAALVPAVVRSLQSGFPELAAAQERVGSVLAREEGVFERTLARGEQLLAGKLEQLRGQGLRELSGSDAFLLHDTFGFPIELTREMLAEEGFGLESGGFERAMEEQRVRARSDAAAKRGVVAVGEAERMHHQSMFCGYDALDASGLVLELLNADGAVLQEAQAGERVRVLLDKTSFYPEKGGQIGDHGRLLGPSGAMLVDDTQYLGEAIVHSGLVIRGTLCVGEQLETQVDPLWRAEIRRHHTSAHLLQYALRSVLGDEVVQAGSWVGPQRMRFDFRAPNGALSAEQKQQVSSCVNQLIRENFPVVTEELSLEEARKSGALFLAGEAYGEKVRVLRAGPSVEFCGGTHAHATGELGQFVLLSEASIGSGVRRIEALVSLAAEEYVAKQLGLLQQLGASLTVRPEEVPERVQRLQGDLRGLERELADLRQELAGQEAQGFLARAEVIGGCTFVPVQIERDVAGVKQLGQALRSRVQGAAVIAVAGVEAGRVTLLVLASDEAVKRGVHAGNVLKAALVHLDGKGGGGAGQAQGAGTRVSEIPAAFAAVRAGLSV